MGRWRIILESMIEQLIPIDRIDQLEGKLAELPQHDFKVIHRFTPGLYIREIHMEAGCLLTSKIHKTEHPFVISKGKVSVWTNEGDEEILEAPHTGITQPGTRRVLLVHEFCVWVTFHPTKLKDVDKIEKKIIQKHINPLLPERRSTLCLG